MTERKGGVCYATTDICEKGLTGKSATVAGVGVPYEELENPEVAVHSDKTNPEECAQNILRTIMGWFLTSTSLSPEG